MEMRKDSSNNFIDGAIDFTCGSIGAVALVYVGQPLDTVKVKMQAFPHLYKGTWDCLRRTFMREGVRKGLYAGTVPAVVANVAENSVLFAAYGACQKFIAYLTKTQTPEELGVFANASAGFLAAFFSSLSLCPTELIKIKMQAAKELAGKKRLKRKTAFQLTRKVITEEGVQGLFKGLVPTMAREMPGYFFFFGGYEGIRIYFTPAGKSKEDCGPWVTMLAGAVGGGILWTVMFPADVVKSRVQLGKMEGSLLHNTLTIARNEGLCMRNEMEVNKSGKISNILLEEIKPKTFSVGVVDMPPVPQGESILSHVDLNDLSEMIDDQLQQEIWTAPLELVDKVSSMYVEGRLPNIYSYQKIKETTQRRVLALYSGLFPTLLRTIPSTAVLLLVYESSRHALHSVIDSRS